MPVVEVPHRAGRPCPEEREREGEEGGGADLRIGVAGRLAIGVSGTWNWFDQTFPSLTLEQPNLTFTGPVFRRLSAFTGLATAHYYLTSGNVQPFVGEIGRAHV